MPCDEDLRDIRLLSIESKNKTCFKNGTEFKGVWRWFAQLNTLNIYHFVGQKQQYSVFLQGNLLGPSLATEHIMAI